MGWGERRCWSWIAPAADRQWERERLDCLSGCNPVNLTTSIQLPAQLRGRASIASPGPLLGANTPIHQQKTGGVVLSSSEAR
jgi:hypothetical protein